MQHLIFAIFCSSSIALIFKFSESKDMNRYAVTTANYFTAFSASIIMMLWKGLFVNFHGLNLKSFIGEFLPVVIQGNNLFSPGSSVIWSITVGVLAGAFFFLSFIYYQKSVKENGVGLSGTFGKLGILIPMCFSIVLWHETPALIQWCGIFLSLISIAVVNISPKDISIKSLNLTLLLLFFFGGMAEFTNKIFQKYSEAVYKDLFLFCVFFTAFVISLCFTLRSRKKFSMKDILMGILVGIPNLFSSYFLIMALGTLPTSVAFPAYSAGSIVLINIGGYAIFGERLSKKEFTAVIFTIIALILINL